MPTLTPFLFITGALTFVLGVIWNASNWTNTFIKVMLLSLAIWSLFLVLQTFGYIAKVG